MTDLTADFNGLLKGKEAPGIRRYQLVPEKLQSFVREAYEIISKVDELHHWLRVNRKAYLSTAPRRKARVGAAASNESFMSDTDRENLDANAKQLIRGLDSKIKFLSTAEKAHRETQRAMIQKQYGSRLGTLGSWATAGLKIEKTPEHQEAEDRLAQISHHRDSILWLLTTRLEECCKTQQEMMTIRLNREVEKTNSLLATARGVKVPLPGDAIVSSVLPPNNSTSSMRAPGGNTGQELSQEQIQRFEQGNQIMLDHFENATAKVRETQESLLEIAELHNMLSSNLEVQASHIDQLVHDSYNTMDNVTSGNKELKKATTRPSAARYTFLAASGLCAFLVVWDLIF